jgi:hypothetical protein
MEISNNRLGTKTAAPGSQDQDPKNVLVFIGLSAIDGTLVVRQNATGDPKSLLNGTTLPGLLATYNTSSSPTKNDRCDITNGIEYQRWVNISAVGNGKTLDVYVDGKLARSCAYKSNFSLNSSNGSAQCYFGLNNNSKDGASVAGFLSNGNFYNYALTPDAVWAIYQAGPGAGFSLSTFFGNLFSTNISFQNTVAPTA